MVLPANYFASEADFPQGGGGGLALAVRPAHGGRLRRSRPDLGCRAWVLTARSNPTNALDVLVARGPTERFENSRTDQERCGRATKPSPSSGK